LTIYERNKNKAVAASMWKTVILIIAGVMVLMIASNFALVWIGAF
jgi:hypothetical protein